MTRSFTFKSALTGATIAMAFALGGCASNGMGMASAQSYGQQNTHMASQGDSGSPGTYANAATMGNTGSRDARIEASGKGDTRTMGNSGSTRTMGNAGTRNTDMANLGTGEKNTHGAPQGESGSSR